MEKKLKQEFEKILIDQRKEYQGYITIVFEDFQSKIKVIAESFLEQQKQLEAIREMVAKNTEDIADLQIQTIAIRRDVEIIKSDIQFIKQELKHKVDRDEFETLEKRVLCLEKMRGFIPQNP